MGLLYDCSECTAPILRNPCSVVNRCKSTGARLPRLPIPSRGRHHSRPSHQLAQLKRVPDRTHPFLIMELVAGQSLEQRLKQGPLELAEAVDIAARLCDALAHHPRSNPVRWMLYTELRPIYLHAERVKIGKRAHRNVYQLKEPTCKQGITGKASTCLPSMGSQFYQ
jgi:serine/threonine protein kinase